MSIRQGNKIISGGDRLPGWGTPLLSCMWADHKLNSVSWLRADTFSWQSGNIYISAYNHLVEDLHDSGTTIHTEVISGNTITYYITPDKHRICLGDQAEVVDAIYQATGISWYFILDEGKKRFKLPRTKWGFTGLRNGAGEAVEAGLPNITGYIGSPSLAALGGVDGKVFKDNPNVASAIIATGQWEGHQVLFDASGASPIYGNSNTVQPPATEMYLYFYVGNFDVNKDILDTAKLSELVNEFNITEFEAEVQESKNKAISEISTIYPEVAKYPGMITNCITEIPQDIKLELNNGNLTLKAGSKVYVPNGPGVFDTVTIANDLTLTQNWGTAEQLVISVSQSGTYLARTGLNRCTSGTTAPTETNYRWWYDTSSNQVKEYSGGAWNNNIVSFPIAIVTVPGDNTTTVTSIDQVFNGFGYIGSTIFALPGVKYLEPNGRKEDGTLKNRESALSAVRYMHMESWMVGRTNAPLTLDPVYGVTGMEVDYKHWGSVAYLKDLASVYKYYSLWYCAEDNKMHYFNSSAVESIVQRTFIGSFNVDSNNKITLLNIKQAFHAVDYSDTKYIAHQAMPSKKYIDLPLGASGSSYTAPADGWVCLDMSNGSGTEQQVALANQTAGNMRAYSCRSISGSGISVIMPCNKGDSIQYLYTATGTAKSFRFIFANGSN